MIVRHPPHWFRMLFVWNGSVLPGILPQIGLMTAVSVLAVFTGGKVFGDKVPLNTASFTLLGLALAIFLAFRNTASYDRFWEGRKIWGMQLIASRALASQVLQYADSNKFDRRLFVCRLIAVAYTLKHQLRHTKPDAELARLLPESSWHPGPAQYVPVSLMHALRGMLAQAHRDGGLSDTQLWSCDTQLNEVNTCIGASERIASTPIPFPYGVLLHRTVYIYCLLLPFGLVDTIGYATPLISVTVAYTFLALEAIASELADPFCKSDNGLALDAMCREIERSLLEMLGDELPASLCRSKTYRLN